MFVKTFICCTGRDNMRVTTVKAFPGLGSDQGPVQISFNDVEILGSGSFGVVYQARLLPTLEMVAIKKVLQDKKYKNRELDIIRKLNHTNIVKLKYFYYSEGKEKQKYLSLILEYFPNNLFDVIKKFGKAVPLPYIKIYTYQLFRSLAYLHSLGICHRDVKPANLLINTETGVLKLCDFGSAKELVKGQTSVSYICSRFYRAPELLFSSTDYTFSIDVWSAGCVLAELMLSIPVFSGDDHISQLVEIMKVLGTPSKEEIKHMNKAYSEYNYPYLSPVPWQEIFKNKAPPEAIDLISRLLVYIPSNRISPLQACAHKYFNSLREPGAKLLNIRELPPLFNFSEQELRIQPNLNHILIPPHLKDSFRPTTDETGTVIAEASSSTHNLTSSDMQSKGTVVL